MGNRVVFIAALALGLIATVAVKAEEGKFDTALIEKLTGAKGVWNKDQTVFKVGFPRKEVKVTVDGTPLPPFMGLGTWAAFTSTQDGMAMVMGDNVLFQDEVNPVMSAALENGLQVTALHNHFFFDEPKVYFMHISGMGKAETLAKAVGKVYAKVHEIRASKPEPASNFGHKALPEKSSITVEPLEKILGVKVTAQDGMVKAVFGRKVKMGGDEMGSDMGVNTWAAFLGSDDNAVVDGDIAMHEDELQSVLKSLRKSGIDIVAIHQHMTGESPRIIFLHYWGHGNAGKLAKNVKEAISFVSN
jgi:phosphotransferase system IIB component